MCQRSARKTQRGFAGAQLRFKNLRNFDVRPTQRALVVRVTQKPEQIRHFNKDLRGWVREGGFKQQKIASKCDGVWINRKVPASIISALRILESK
jgi:hypothetical protein